MGLFRKESRDIIDFTMLQKRGILKKEAPLEPLSTPIDPKTGFIDLTVPSPSASPFSQTTPSQDLFGLLDTHASHGTSSSLSSPSLASESGEIQSLKIKIDDLEFKLERLLEKLSAMESKFVEEQSR